MPSGCLRLTQKDALLKHTRPLTHQRYKGVLLLLVLPLLIWPSRDVQAGSLDFFVEAVRKNHINEVRRHLENGIDVNSRDIFGDNAGLHWAARQGQAKMARLLIDNGADLDIRNREGETPLHWAASEGQKELVVILIVHGAEVNALTRKGWTPLRWAEAHREKEIARILIAAGGRR